MSDDTKTTERKYPLGGDLIIPVLATAFAIYYLYTIAELPWQAAVAGIGVITAMAILLVVLVIRFIGQYRSGEADLRIGDLVEPRDTLILRGGLLLLALAFIFSMPYLGFTTSLFLFVFLTVLMLAGRTHIKTAIALALGMSLSGYLLFILLIRARFPHGPFENLIDSLL